MKLLLCFLLCLFRGGAQEKGEPTALHIKSVNTTSDETDKGTWFHIKVSAESKTVFYSLSCDEFLSNEAEAVVICFHVEAGKDHEARKLPNNSISFWPPGTPNKKNGALVSTRTIVAEKEK
jgi:hypothetical protein